METAVTQPVRDQIAINDKSIINELKYYNSRPEDAICEYIWNAFDAEATNVRLTYAFAKVVEGGDAFGYPSFSLEDDGNGWDLSDRDTIKIFLDSKKRLLKKSYKSLPHGSKGVGRFTFHSFASRATWVTRTNKEGYELNLEKTDLNHYGVTNKPDNSLMMPGTSINFLVDSKKLTPAFFESELKNRILARFSWFLILNPLKRIYINDLRIDPEDYIERSEQKTLEVEGVTFDLKLVQWKKSLVDNENSKLYFSSASGEEVCKFGTGLNFKADHFYHSAYATSIKLKDYTPLNIGESDDTDDTDEPGGQESLFEDDPIQPLLKEARKRIREELEVFRKPYILAHSDELVDEWLKHDKYPKPEQFGVDPDQYRDLVKQTLVIAPELYVRSSDDQRRVVLSLLASLMSTSESSLIVTILNQVYDLSSEERETLRDILGRTTLKNILSTIKEIEQRLQTIEDLDQIINDPKYYRETKEVIHLQQILNKETWIFGEEYRLIIDTEGSIRTAIKKWAKEMLDIEDFDPESHDRKELDLFLAKKIETEKKITNLVIELKRPSVKLGSAELNQIKNYRDKLLSEPACKGDNMEWRFLLVGQDYDHSIKREIESHKSWGEADNGLVDYVESERTKIYVRRWTDILNAEQRSKHRFLKDKLQLKLKDHSESDVDEIVTSATTQPKA